MEQSIPTLVFDEFPLDSNEVNQWSCVFCDYSDEFWKWSLGMFAGNPTAGEIVIGGPD